MDKELLDAGYRAYTGEKIDVYFNTDICQHSGNWRARQLRSFQPETQTVESSPMRWDAGHGS